MNIYYVDKAKGPIVYGAVVIAKDVDSVCRLLRETAASLDITLVGEASLSRQEEVLLTCDWN